MENKDKKELVMCLDINSNEFEKKLLYSLFKVKNVRINPVMLYDNKEGDIDRYAFALMNTQSSKKKVCNACGGIHRYFTKKSISEEKGDEKGLCDTCGIILQNLVLFKADQKMIEKWIISNGEIDPYDLMRDGIQNMVKSGEIKMKQEVISEEENEY